MQADLLAPAIATVDLAAFMRAALYEAEQAGFAGELPIGAVLVIDSQIISRGRAQHQAQRNQLRHAELNALLAGLSFTHIFSQRTLREKWSVGRCGFLPHVLASHENVRLDVTAPTNRVALPFPVHSDLWVKVRLAGGEALWEHHDRAILFTSAEPCPLCLGAAVMADVPHIIFAAHDENVHSRQTVAENPYVRRHIQSYYGGVLEAEAHAIMARFDPTLLRRVTTGH